VSHFEVKNTSCCNFVNEKSTTIFGRFEKASIFEFPKKEKKISPCLSLKCKLWTKRRKEKRKEAWKSKNSFLACVSNRQEKNLQKIKKCTKKSQNISLKKKSYVLGTTMFKKKQKNSTYRATTPQASLNIYETLVLKRSKKTHRNYLKN